ncbi:myeloid lymphoid or mixed-lineage leukemia (trithorax, ) [Cyanidiococcus yangmingshanensis]|uniref:Myeloid lymphoid or mixed-lineage leukemia (Trithorax, ) n=1 Tax=Cyanidiococcus yangmingshanensis TaxID=2690220 RepID=A0A7J7IK28_9RHOD|nr:myeloid lymphoid or mixed-lineage leukemia (trithorax, ) [Cyanidiococcus yangmingshanensis]
MVRVRGLQIERRLVHGSVAFWQGPRAPETKTHRWTVYVRGASDPLEDLSVYIRKVEFVLHESFSDPVRVVTQAPFCLTEYGWGEFEIIIRLFPLDDAKKPVELYHPLRLFPPPGQELSEKPVVSEHADVLVFVEPSTELERTLREADTKRLAPESWGSLLPLFGGDLKEVEIDDLRKVRQARERVRQQIEALRQEYETLTKELERSQAQTLHRHLS